MPGIRTASHAKDQVKDQVSPTLHRAQETLTDTVLPAIRDALFVAKERSSDLLESDRAHEARRRGRAVVRAARGDTAFVTPTRRRWRFGLGMLAVGGGIGYGLAWLSRRMAAPVDTYATGGMSPAPSGTDGGTTTMSSNGSSNGTSATPHAPSGTPTRDINLSAGAPTKF